MPDFARRRLVMVDTQVRTSDVSRFPIIDAMLNIPREEFVPQAQREAAYMGENLDLGQGRAMLDPRSLAKLLNGLAAGPTDLAMMVGAAYGYGAAVMARMAQAVVAVEEDPVMATEAQSALAMVSADNATVHEGPLIQGAPKHAPYDVICIEGGVERIPDALLDQLAEGGRIGAIFVEDRLGIARIGFKVDGRINWRYAFNGAAPILPGFAAIREFSL